MQNIKLTIQYDGTDYCGWQVQKESVQCTVYSVQKKSIQGTIEEALRKILREKVKVIGSGRTDAGVHALGQVANFKTKSKLEPNQMLRALNALLPASIRIIDACKVKLDFHAQFDAKSKIYCYLIYNNEVMSPFLLSYAHFVPFSLSVSLIDKEILCLKGEHDFRSFCASNTNTEDTIRTIKRIAVGAGKGFSPFMLPDSNKFIIITLEADGFLYNMVRNITGTLIDIATGRFKKGAMKLILEGHDRRAAGKTAPAKGLYLLGVKY
jgi:tRNA pseudouridine38-40 synthase